MSGYSGGGASKTKKTLKAWTPQHWSAKEDIDKNLRTLRDRAADLAMNSPIGSAAIQTQSTNVIGSGLKVFPRLRYKELGMTAEQARDWSRHTKQEFELWAKDLHCDFLRRNNFYELQDIAFQNYLLDGDGFCLLKRRPPSERNPYSLRLQLIEAQRVSNPLDKQFATISQVETLIPSTGGRIVNGIEVNRDGRLEAIWVCNKIWNEPQSVVPELSWQRVRIFGRDTGCRNVLHVCHDMRPDQFRGVPYLAPVIETLKQLMRYADAELTSAVIKSYFSIFFVQLQQSNYDFNQIAGEGERDPNEACVDVSEYKIGSATMAALPRGVDVKAIDSNNAQSTFDAFTNAFLTQICSALGLPLEVLTKSFKASYSASRAALLQASDEFRRRKAWFINDFCQPIYEEFLSEAVALGRIKAPKFFEDPLTKSLWSSADWYNERSGILDPVKETQAMILRLEAGLSTYEKEINESTGMEFSDVVDTLSQERKILSELPPLSMQPSTDAAENADSDDDTEDEDENQRRKVRRQDDENRR